LILMGSENDRRTVEPALKYYEYFGIEAVLAVSSAHRDPARTAELAAGARDEGFSLVVCCAGMAAHLAGAVAAQTTLPVIGVPLAASDLNGMDALLSTVQMPAGIPVATLALGKAGAVNAAVLAARILSLEDPEMRTRLEEFTGRGSHLA